ncbi:MAG: peptidoglycan glycosyltransferase [Clostridiales bacterium]|nr:peptidoglycan glycosyltransferase [Clostridiales bacterium]MBO4580566.1 peptidoglycan glycosyltransferase [Clostridiales bacterium]
MAETLNKNRTKTQGFNDTSSKVLVLLTATLVFIYSAYVVFTLYNTSVSDYKEYAKAASGDQWKLLTYSADRGMIYDSNGVALASNTYDYTVVCSPKEVKSDTMTRESIISACVNMLGVTYEKLDSIIPVDPKDGKDPRTQVAGCDVIKNIPLEKKEAFEEYCKENKIKGFGYVAVPQRYYNYGTLAAQVIGYARNNGEVLAGVYGLEAYYNDVLSGNDGYRYSEVDDITGGVLPYSEATSVQARDGNNIVTHLDLNIQRIAEEACRKAYDKYKPKNGVTSIVMDPYTGAIYAMVSMPDFDLNNPYAIPYGMDMEEWQLMSSEDQIQYIMGNCWRNRCVSDTYEPGSTFKSLTTCMAFEENLSNEEEELSDAPIKLSEFHTISCWLQKSRNYNHGTETLFKGFQNSCNPIFVQLAQRIGLKKYYNYVRMLGFYDKTGIDLPAEGTGIFHKKPQEIDMSVLSYGEGSTVTPIQLIMSYCAIINGGDLMVPHIAKYITDSEGNIVDEIEPEVVRTVFSEKTCARVRTMMEAVVSDGTGKAGQVAGYNVAGKTSTSTIDAGADKGAHVLSFSCYAPANDPKIAVLVVLNQPADHSVGSSSAAATAAEIVEGTLTYMGVERTFSEDDYKDLLIEYYVPKVDGKPASEASSSLSVNGLTTINGTLDMNSDTIIARTYPNYTNTLYKTGVVVMYPDGVSEDQMLTTRVPNLKGMTAIECIEALKQMNLNCKVDGDVTGICVEQSESLGTTVLAGSIIKVTMGNTMPTGRNDDTDQTDEGSDGTHHGGGNISDSDEDGFIIPTSAQDDEDSDQGAG